jgi:protein tyrosine phosphatase
MLFANFHLQRFFFSFVLLFLIIQNGEKRVITQFHFLAWPDHGVPDESAPLLEMMLSVNKLHEESSSKSPIVVHCSAGIGRTGTYVIVSTIVELINASVKEKFSFSLKKKNNLILDKARY